MEKQLFNAINIKDIDEVKKWIKMGVNVNARDKDKMTALHWAYLYNYTEIAEALIEAGADINAKNVWGKNPFDNIENFKLQLICNMTPTDERQSEVMKALKWKYYDIAKLLIELGEQNINLKNSYERDEILRLLMPKCCYDGFTLNINQKHCCSHLKYVNIIKKELFKISIPIDNNKNK